MSPIPVEAFISQHQESRLSLPTAIQGAPGGQTGRVGSRRRLSIVAAWCNRGWLAALLLVSAGAWAQSGIFSTPQAIGVSTTQPVTVTAQVTGTLDKVEVLTVGASGLDFAVGGGTSTCTHGLAVTKNAVACSESVTFKPIAPGLRVGAVLLLDSSKNVLGTAYLSGTGSGGLGVLVSGNILPVAGDGHYKDAVKDNILATTAELYIPSGVTVDGAGNLYIADTLHNRIRMVCASATSATIHGVTCPGAGIILTVGGTGETGDTGDGALATDATLNLPSGVALDGAGNLYIADTANNVIRKITAATGIITTVAGNGTPDYAGDGLSATSLLVELNGPQGVTIDAGGNLYIADTLNQRIRVVAAATGIITTVAGNGTAGNGGDGLSATSSSAELNFPDAVAFDSQGNWYIADSLNNRIRKVSIAGVLSTFAGSGVTGNTGDGDQASAAELNAPSGVAVDPAGNVYIADTQNNAIRKVSSASGIISTIAKTGVGVYYVSTLTPPFMPVTIHGPLGLFLDGSANLYFADAFNNVIREIQSNFVALDFTALGTVSTRQGTTAGPLDQTVENDGNAPLNLTAPDIFVDTDDPLGFPNAALDPSTTCPTSNPFLAEDGDCVIAALYAPSLQLTFGAGVKSESLDADIDIGQSGDTINSPLVIELIGTATPLNSTQVVLTSSQNPSDFGTSVSFMAVVSTGTGTLSTSSTVTFYDGGTQLGTPIQVSLLGSATYTTSLLTVGSHTITAQYNGDSSHYASTVDAASTVTQVVNEGTATSLQSSANPSVLGVSVTFTATVTIPAGGGVPLDGTVTFKNGGTTLCTSNLVLNATVYSATCPTAALPQGQSGIQATYNGDALKFIAGSTSPALTQDVQAASSATFTANPGTSYYGGTVVFTVTVPTIGNTPAGGTVNILEAGKTIGTVTLVAGVGKFTPATPLAVSTSAAPDVLTASYAGDINYGPFTLTASEVVNQATTSTAIKAVPSPAALGAPVTLTATVAVTNGVSTPTGNVNFTDTFNGSTVTLACTPQPTVAAPTCTTSTLAAGTHSIVATYVGDTNDAGSSSSALPLTVVQETITFTPDHNPSTYGSPVIFTVTIPTIGSTAATGKVNILEAGQATAIGIVNLVAGTGAFTTSLLPASTSAAPDIITASYVGNANYPAITSAQVLEVVNQAQTTTVVSATPNPAAAGSPVTLTATVKGTQSSAPLKGNVVFTDSVDGGATFTVPCTPQPTAPTATCNTSALPVGTNSIVATYAGDANDASSNGNFTLTVVQETIPFTSSPNPSTYGDTVTFIVTIPTIGSTAATGKVNIFEAGVATPIKTLTLTGNPGSQTFTISSLPVGTDVITASYVGDANYPAITSLPVNQVVNQSPTTTTVAAKPNPGIASLPIAITATVKLASGAAITSGTVSFTSGTNSLGSATLGSAGTATVNPALTAGSYSIIATFTGDGNDASSSGTLALTVNLAETQTSVSASPNPAVVDSPVTLTAKVTGNGGTPTGDVTFTDTLNSVTATLACTPVLVAEIATCTTSTLAAGTHSITANYLGDANDAPSTFTINLVVGKIPTVIDLGVSTTGGATPQPILIAVVLNSGAAGSTPTPTGPVTLLIVPSIGTAPSATLDSSGVATFTPNLAAGVSYSIIAAYAGDDLHSASQSSAVSVSGTASGFTLTVNPASVSMATKQSATVNVTLSSKNGFTDSIGLGCGSLPAGVNCHFSAAIVTLAANGTEDVTLTIDTNNPLGGGSSAMNGRPGGRGVSLAGFFLPLSFFFGCILWRFRRRHALAMTAALLLLLGVGAQLITGCGGFSQSSAAPGTYTIQVTGVGSSSDISHYQNVTLTITQ